MKLSTKGIYAVEAMVDLAIYGDGKVESIKNIARRRNLSEKYLEQIIGELRKNGLIKSIRGPLGGYQITKNLSDITVKDILSAVEQQLIPLECLYKKTNCGIDCDNCATRSFWNELWNKIDGVIDNVTIEQLVEESKKQKIEEVLEYYI